MVHAETITKKIDSYLRENDWTFEYDMIHGIFSVEADLESKLGTALVVYQAMEDGFVCYTTIAEEARKEIMPMVGEYLHRANYGLPNGNFALDYESGEIHFKTYFDCPDKEPTQKQLEDSMAIGLMVFDHYGDGLYEILHSDSLAKQLMEKLEMW